MTWTKFDDSFSDREDVLSVGRSARWLLAEAYIWCNRMETDGRLPANVLPRISDSEDLQGDYQRAKDFYVALRKQVGPFGTLDDEFSIGKIIQTGEMVLVKMGHDNSLYLVGFYSKLRQQRRRFNEIFSLRPFRRDVIRMISGIYGHRALGTLDQPENISNRFIPFEITAHARHNPRTPPVFTHPGHQRVN